MTGLEGYSEEVRKVLASIKADVGRKIAIERDGKIITGRVMPRIGGDPNSIIIKMENGYNVGIKFSKGIKIKLQKEKSEESKKGSGRLKISEKIRSKIENCPEKPTIVILHTGGTIASKLDYRTGGTIPMFEPREILGMYPELGNIANIRARVILQMFSEDMEPSHWQQLAKEVYKEITEEGCDGIIITHGTDTLHYTAAALSFMLHDLPIPVLLVGSQRSSDRPSSDAAMNLISACRFIANSDWSGIGICMHESINDDICWVLPATRSRKLHTSRRDAFRPINAKPIARINWELNSIEMVTQNYPKKDFSRIPKLDNVFDEKIALIKSYPGFRAEQLEWYEKNCHGIVFEGSGIAGNLPINTVDEKTRHHTELLKKLKEMVSKGIIIYMTSQCIYGRINMNVYQTGRDMQAAGCLPAYMIPETAYVKLGWVLGHTRDREKVKEMMEKDFAGEIIERSEHREFPDKDLEK